MTTRPTNKISPRGRRHDVPTIRKIPADSVPYGESISANGRAVWAAYDGETLVAVAASAGEARRKYGEIRAREGRERTQAVNSVGL
jgi:hypothetical protein